MRIMRKMLILMICVMCLFAAIPQRVCAETISVEELLAAMPASEIVAVECSTGQVLFEKNSAEAVPVSHLAKLMLILLAAERLESGEFSLTDTVTVSANANSMPDPQIWLDKGEKISAEDLIKAVTIGNANDGAVALAEHIFGSTEAAVGEMNSKAKLLDMTATYYADVCGSDKKTVSSAADTAKLAAELVKYETLTPYFTAWIDYVREGKAELVNRNRLVRTYKGITGMKACSSSAAGECAVVTACKRDMDVAVVILGCDSRDNCDDIGKKLLDMCYESYSLYAPEPEEDMLTEIPVKGGEEKSVPVTFGELPRTVIPKGSSATFDMQFMKSEELEAPVKKGQVCGRLTCYYGDREMYSAELVAARSVKEISFTFCLKQMLLYLLRS